MTTSTPVQDHSTVLHDHQARQVYTEPYEEPSIQSSSSSPSMHSDENHIAQSGRKGCECGDYDDCTKCIMEDCHCDTKCDKKQVQSKGTQVSMGNLWGHEQNRTRPQTRHSRVTTNPFETDIPSVKGSDVSQEHWHLLTRFVGSKRKCSHCGKKGIIHYKGELFLPEGAAEVIRL